MQRAFLCASEDDRQGSTNHHGCPGERQIRPRASRWVDPPRAHKAVHPNRQSRGVCGVNSLCELAALGNRLGNPHRHLAERPVTQLRQRRRGAAQTGDFNASAARHANDGNLRPAPTWCREGHTAFDRRTNEGEPAAEARRHARPVVRAAGASAKNSACCALMAAARVGYRRAQARAVSSPPRCLSTSPRLAIT